MTPHDRNLCADCLLEDYENFRHACVHEAQANNESWRNKYRIDDYPRWDYSMQDATLMFSIDGKNKVVCNMQVIGSLHGSSWEWSWGNPNLPDACRERVHEVRALGEEKQWCQLTHLFSECGPFTASEYGSIAAHILGAIALYRCGDENDAVWVVVMSSEFVN